MKLIILSLALFGCAIADDGPQRALLVLPQPYSSTSGQQTESLDRLNERLRQEQGSQEGNYHLYLNDGRLQRVQYTAAPLRNPTTTTTQTTQQVSVQNTQNVANSNTYQFNQQNAQANGKLQTFTRSEQPNLNSDSYSRVSYQGTKSQASGSADNQATEPHPVVAHFGRLQQERIQQQLAGLQQQQEQLKRQQEQLQQQLQQQQQFASNYVATIQFNDVPPIPAPIYSQSPAPITRILRYAPYY